MRKLKLLGITTCALLGAGLIGGGIVSQNISASAEDNNVQLVEMEHGASLRIDGNFGMRFQTSINKTWFDGLAERAEVHVLLMLESKLGSAELVKGMTGVTDAVLTNRIVKDDVYTYNAVLTEIPEDCYNKSVVARVYVQEPNKDPVYTENTQTRSVVYVANAALNDKFDTYYESIGSYLLRGITVEETKWVPMSATGVLNAYLDYFNGASMEVQEQFDAKTEFVYTSDNEDVVLIDAGTGEFTAKNAGTATITASAWGKEAKCVVTVDAMATYKTNHVVNVPETLSTDRTDANYAYEGGFYVDNEKSDPGSEISLGDGLYVDMKPSNPNADTKIATWRFPYALDFNKVLADTPFINLMTIPDNVLTCDYDYLAVILRDTVDSNRYIKIRAESVVESSGYSFTRVRAGHSRYLNENGQPVNKGNDNGAGFTNSSNINGSMNFQFGYSDATKEIYAYKNYNTSRVQEFTRLCNFGIYAEDALAEGITNDGDWYLSKTYGTSQTTELFAGFTDGKAYLELELYNVKTADGSSGVYIRDILGYDLATLSRISETAQTSYTTEYKTNVKDEEVDGLKVRLNQGSVFTVNNVNMLTNSLSFRVIPKTIGTEDFSTLYIHIQDTESTDNITLKLTGFHYTGGAFTAPGYWSKVEYYSNGTYVSYNNAGLSNFKGTTTIDSNHPNNPITHWFNMYLTSDGIFKCNMDHRDTNMLGKDNGVDRTISIRNANISIWAEDYTNDAPAVIFFSSLFSQDLTAYN